MIGRRLSLTASVLLVISVVACQGVAKAQIVGKWEATVTHKRSGNVTKMLWEFLPDGTFTVAPLEDPTTFVDKNTYQILDEGKSVKIRSQLVDDATCIVEGSTMSGETPETLVKFKKL